jgi:gamma-glutamyltranspeptidase/glutathione hydrolase
VPALADCLETLAIEGPELFYAGETAAAIDAATRAGGGHLRRDDLANYQVAQREPLTLDYGGHRVQTNAPPASGGVLVAFGLSVMAGLESGADPLDPDEALRTARALQATTAARSDAGLDEGVDDAAAAHLLDPATVAAYRRRLAAHPAAYRGTTHISVADAAGNTAALTTSNGEGCGWIVPDTGFMLNNVLGEADLQPRGFGQWPEDVRLTSMMAPTLLQSPQGTTVALGSGGSNRIRSAITQVLAGQVDHGLDLAAALERPRLHVEGERLEIEGGFPAETIRALAEHWPDHCAWPERNLFFGGAHGVSIRAGRFDGAGDPRRGGVAAIV